mmetsp:Transcript_24571/g.51123  ORF Transcript_24571/g.51123 Transcript_24571/m.51123 type:complete len:245 (-) Transcript_24571:46-780(-)
MKTRTEGNGSLGRVNLKITKRFFVVGGDNHIDGLNGTAKCLVKFFSRKLKFEKGTIDLVDHEHGFDTFGNSLTKNSFGLDTDTVNGINNDQSTISHTKGGSNLRREINVTRTVNQVDQVRVLRNLHVGLGFLFVLDFLCNSLFFFLGNTGGFSGFHIVLEKHGNTSGLNGNTTLGFVGTSISVTGTTGSLGRNNTSLLHQRIRQSRLTVIDVSNHRHRTDVVLQVHNGPHLVYGKVHHLDVFPF